MPLKLLALNIQGNNHLEKVIALAQRERPDVVCFQDTHHSDMKTLQEGMEIQGWHYPILRKEGANGSLDHIEGTSFWTNLPHSPVQAFYYEGEGTIPQCPDLSDPHHRVAWMDRVFVSSTVTKGDHDYTIGTTHFTLTRNGIAKPRQWKAFGNLMGHLEEYDDLIFAGDVNAPRGKQMFAAFASQFTDNLPESVTSTLDQELHKSPRVQAGLQIACDTIFTTPHYQARVEVIDGVSDHKALIATVNRTSCQTPRRDLGYHTTTRFTIPKGEVE